MLARLALVFLLVTPGVAFAAPSTFKELIDRMVAILDLMVPILIAVALVTYLYGIASNILDINPSKGSEKLKSFYLWGILILFVMVSVWGILRLAANTLFQSGGNFSGGSTQQVDLDCSFGECGQ